MKKVFLFIFLLILIGFLFSRNTINKIDYISIISKNFFFSKIIILDNKHQDYKFLFDESIKIVQNISKPIKIKKINFSSYITIKIPATTKDKFIDKNLTIFYGNERIQIEKITLPLIKKNKYIQVIINDKIYFYTSYHEYSKFVSKIEKIKKKEENK